MISHDIISKDSLLSFLSDIDIEVFYFDELNSSNNFARLLATENFTTPVLVVTNSQSAGRGRQGNSFFSPKGAGIYMSILLKIGEGFNSEEITIRAAASCIKAIKTISGKQISIKWVNDLFLDNRKIGGILTESISDSQSIVVGIGINVFSHNFPPDLANIAGSLNCENISRSHLIAEITKNILLDKDPFSRTLFFYKENCFILGQEIRFSRDGKEYSGLAIDINEKGNLLVKVNDNNILLDSGEISLKSSSYTY